MSAPAGRRRRTVSARQRVLADAVVAVTGRLVGLAMSQSWAEMPRALGERRRLLADLEREPRQGPHDAGCVAALRSAVNESERVLTQLCSAASAST